MAVLVYYLGTIGQAISDHTYTYLIGDDPCKWQALYFKILVNVIHWTRLYDICIYFTSTNAQ